MFLVRGAKNRDGQRSADWIKAAIGTVDSYGNPFEIVEMAWRMTNLNRNSDYVKTRGFEDTEIAIDRNKGITVRHIRQGNGCIMWERSLNGIGPFVGRLGKTPYNMLKLAKHYKDGLWTIKDRIIDAELKALSDKMWSEMTPEQQRFNEARIKSMHSLKSEEGMNSFVPTKVSKEDVAAIEIEKKELFRMRKELEEKEQRLKGLEGRYGSVIQEKVAAGALPTKFNSKYSKQQLLDMRPSELRQVARREFELRIMPFDNREEVMRKILNHME
jgi:hypothetical protein